jgi:two-component system, response regulator PdtaR
MVRTKRNIWLTTACTPCRYNAVTALNILVVEDDFLIGTLLSETLVGLGHCVFAVERTEAGAVAAAARLQPELMIVDAHLSNGNGISAVEQIVQSRFIPHIFVTGDKFGTLLRRPNDIVIEKPFRERDLVQAIARAIAREA